MIQNIKIIFNEDQKDREEPDFWNKTDYYSQRDLRRRQKVAELLLSNALHTGEDFYQGAVIFHHSDNLDDLEKAKDLAQKSSNLNFNKAKWLYAAISDRISFVNGQPQKYGTQFFKKNAQSRWKLHPVDLTVTDEERAEYNVPNLNETKKQINKLNQN